MKFLPHFPPLMLILFKVYQLENILCNLNANDSSKYVWGRYITPRVTYWFFFFLFFFHLCKCLHGSHPGARQRMKDAIRQSAHL